ncbi:MULTISPECIES: ABC transporter ATP-binding protein [Halomonadaceae]|uniref:ABC transporter ATP-binding protein n=2 Tax=Vreelandella TaxID=3137766 RepID=A0A7Z0LQV7_9GAMM|nr:MULTISPECIES: ABC transporter ATP-binding protein [Halomonas]AJY51619.1 ABC transporter related protein [Halomonas sp. KO116]NYS76942.1 ABC transporter ATP-binding protein [Halomonas glaciei]|tara:strand:- start:4958 stop:5692 length:735 start_codon:yes stop_codon:yes gene_type:complete
MSENTKKSDKATVLECRQLSSGYDDATVIDNINIQITEGQVFGILGKNGMGKSTLLKTIMGFLKPINGEIYYADQPIGGLEPQVLARRGIAYIPQEAAIFQDLTVEENLRLGLPSDRLLPSGMEKVAAYFPIIPQRRKQFAGTLSGGEQKMLLMARALMSDPKLMLVDEISEGLQPTMVENITQVLGQVAAKENTSVLLVEQNVRLVTRVAHSVALLEIGRIVQEMQLDDGADNELALTEMMRV